MGNSSASVLDRKSGRQSASSRPSRRGPARGTDKPTPESARAPVPQASLTTNDGTIGNSAADSQTISPRAVILAVQHQMACHPGFVPAATAACITLAVQLSAHRVTIGWYENQVCKPVASSRGAPALMPQLDHDAISGAMHESLNQQALIANVSARDGRYIVVASKALARMQPSGAGLVISLPLASEGKPVGSLCVEFDSKQAANIVRQLPSIANLLESIIPVAARLLLLEHIQSLPWPARLRHRMQQFWHDDSERRTRHRRWLLIGLSTVAAAVLLIPVEQKISSDAQIQGSVQRTVVATAEGYLKSVAVRPGDTVAADQILAHLGKRELELKRDKLVGQIDQFQADASTAIAVGDRSAMAVSRAMADQANAELSLIDRQLEQTRVRAPFDGIVIAGDLHQSIGSPVDRGQNLFTIAPIDSWRVLVQIDENDIALIKEGQSGQLYLSAIPWQSIEVEVDRISPAATISNGSNIFEVHASINNPPDILRPGLKGTVRLTGQTQSLARRMTRRVIDSVGRFIWRWQPW